MSNQLPRKTSLNGTEDIIIVDADETKKVTSSVFTVLNGYPKELGYVQLGTPSSPILAGDEYEYIIPLGANYSEVVLCGFQWVNSGAPTNSSVAVLLGRGIIINDPTPYFLATKIAGNAIRNFQFDAGQEIVDNVAVSPASPIYSNVTTAGAAIGYGTNPGDNAFDNTELYSHNQLEVKQVFISGQDLHVVVKNCNAVTLHLVAYTGITSVSGYGWELGQTFDSPGFVSVFGSTGMVLASTYRPEGVRISTDSGNSWFATNTGDMSGIFAMASAGVANNYFVAFADYSWSFFTYDHPADSWTDRGVDIWTEGKGAGQRHIDALQFDNVYSNVEGGGRGLDIITGTAVLINFEEFKARVEKSTDTLTTFSTILQLEDLVSDISPTDRYLGTTCTSYAKIIDANTYLTAFSYYSFDGGSDYHIKHIFAKTITGGTSWTQLLTAHPEFVNATQKRIWSDDAGLLILVVIFDAASGNTLFNKSIDGGSTWLYSTGSWPVVAASGTFNSNYFVPNNNFTADILLTQSPMGEVMLVLRNNLPAVSNGSMCITRTTDDGLTWTTPVQLSTNINAFSSIAIQGANANDSLLLFLDRTQYNNAVYKGNVVSTFTNWKMWGLPE